MDGWKLLNTSLPFLLLTRRTITGRKFTVRGRRTRVGTIPMNSLGRHHMSLAQSRIMTTIQLQVLQTTFVAGIALIRTTILMACTLETYGTSIKVCRLEQVLPL